MVTSRRKKLIEVALPLDEINAASKADKDRKTGTIRNFHKWFAPMPLPAWRALLFAALVDDPETEEQRIDLLDLIKRLVSKGANLPFDGDLADAKAILARQFPDGLPSVMDPFCGGGSTLIEAQRLGLETNASDLNPVPVLITRALTELLPSVNGLPAVSRKLPTGATTLDVQLERREPSGFDGLIADVMHYAEVVRREAWERVGSNYPSGEGERIIAWLWARSARCVNPACGIHTPLTTSWWLSKKRSDLAWIDPVVSNGQVRFDVIANQRSGGPVDAPKIGRGAAFACVACGAVITEDALQTQASGGGLGPRLTAVAFEDERGVRHYRSPGESEEEIALSVVTDRTGLEVPLADDPRSIWCVRYGVTTQADLYLARQLDTLTTLADLIAEVHVRVISDGGSAQWADAVTTLLGLALGRLAMSNSTQARTTIRNDGTTTRFNAAFGRNDLPMTWDFPELNPLDKHGTWSSSLPTVLDALSFVPKGSGKAVRSDARTAAASSPGLVATDPPYFDAIGYADLSDYFYVWHRRALRNVHPDLYATIATPKANELTAITSHHESKEAARSYFIEGFTDVFHNLQDSLRADLPMLVVYASKEQRSGRDEETRWSSILTAMMNADLEITATWPIHGTGSTRMVGQGTNAIASYIVMACRPRSESATSISLADFSRILRRELAPAVRNLQAASILPIDLAQAAMGPGMQIYSRYRAVLDQAGDRVPVEQALRMIDAARAEVLDEQEGELDPESRFAVRWWATYGWTSAPFDAAEKTARPLGIGIDDVVRAQVATSKANRVNLLGGEELDSDWSPSTDRRATAWEAVHHLANRLIDGGGELEAAVLMSELGSLREATMTLTYRLHDLAAATGRVADQERYNALINSWSELLRLSSPGEEIVSGRLF